MTETVPDRAGEPTSAASAPRGPLPRCARGPRAPGRPHARAPAQLPAGLGLGRPRRSTTPRPTRARCRTTTCWCRPPASTASPRAGCWPTSTGTTCRCARSRATPPTRARAGATAPKGPPRSTSSTTRSGSCTRCGGSASAAAASGSASAGTPRWTTSRPGSAAAITEGRHEQVGYHVGRPGEDGFAERVLQAWGVDGHNSHTNVCSSGARLGQTLWGGYDRPSPDHANAKVILLFSSHLETGHYFNPHAQRIMEGKQAGAKLVVVDPRLSNTAGHADLWIAPWPGSEAAILLAVASLPAAHPPDRRAVPAALVQLGRLPARAPPLGAARRSRRSSTPCRPTTREYTFAFAAQRGPGAAVEQIEELARLVAQSGGRLAAHIWRSAAAGNLGGWQVARTLWFVLASDRLDRHPRRHRPQRLEQVHPARPRRARPRPLERAGLARRVPAVVQRDVDPAPALPRGGPREHGRVLLPRVQPGLDLPGRVHLDAGPSGPGEGAPARRAHPDLVGDRGVRRLRPPDGALHRAARHPLLRDARRQVARLPPAGEAGRDGEARPPRRRHPRRQPGRGLGGERAVVRAVVADRPRRRAGHPAPLRVALPAG